MAKRVKTKKGSIGKKALAAILAASMVLSSSAFSVLAAEVSTVSDAQMLDYPVVASADEYDWTTEKAKVQWVDEGGTTVTDTTSDSDGTHTYTGKSWKINKITLTKKLGGGTQEITVTNDSEWAEKGITITYDKEDRKNVGTITANISAEETGEVPKTDVDYVVKLNITKNSSTPTVAVKPGVQTTYYKGMNLKDYFIVQAGSDDVTDNFDLGATDDGADGFEVTATANSLGTQNFNTTTATPLSSLKYQQMMAYFIDPTPEASPKEVSTFDAEYTGSAITRDIVVYDCDPDNSHTADNHTGNADTDPVCMKLVEGRDYTITWKNNVNSSENAILADEKPQAIIDFTGSEKYKGYGKMQLFFTIGAINIGDATLTEESVENMLERAFPYTGKDQYPGNKDVTVTTEGGKTLTLREGTDYKVIPYPNNGVNDLRTACDANGGLKNGALCDGKGFALQGINGYTGIITKATKDGVDNLTYHIYKINMSDSNIRVETQKLLSKIGGFTASDSAVTGVYDILPVNEDKLAATEYTVTYQHADGTWGAIPENEPGTYKLKVTATGNARNFKKDSSVETSYEVIEKNELQMYVDQGIKYENNESDGDWYTAANAKGYALKDGAYHVVYDGTDKRPAKIWDAAELTVSGTATLKKDVDYTIATAKSKWIKADTYVLTLNGKGRLRNQTAEVRFIIDPKPLNVLSSAGKSAVNTPGDITIKAEQGTHTKSGTASNVVVTVTDEIEGDVVVLTRGEDYDFSVTGSSVTIEGMNNYTTDLGTGNPKVHVETIVPNRYQMHIGDPDVIGRVTKDYSIDVRGSVVKVDGHYIELIEQDTPENVTLLHETDFEITGYEQDGKLYGKDASNPTANGYGVPKPGKAYVIVTGKGRFYGTKKIEFTVSGTKYEDAVNLAVSKDLKLNAAGYVTAADIAEAFTLTYSSTGVTVPREDYKIQILDANGDVVAEETTPNDSSNWTNSLTEAGTYTLRIVPVDNRYEGVKDAQINVVGLDISKEIEVKVDSAVYTGEAQEPAVTVTWTQNDSNASNDVVLTKDIDYTVKYGNNVNAGTDTVAIVNLTGKYSGSYTTTFTISKADGYVKLSDDQKALLEKGMAVDSSTKLDLEGYLKDGDKKVNDTTLSYSVVSDSEDVVSVDGTTVKFVAEGSATLTITPVSGNLNLTDNAITVNVVVKKDGATTGVKTPTITLSNKISKTKKTFTVTTCKVPGATKWVVQYSLKNTYKADGNLQGYKERNFTKANRLKQQVIKCNKSGKRYYVRVKAYVPGKGWSAWSETADPDELEYIKSR